jgi:hypothetical protein
MSDDQSEVSSIGVEHLIKATLSELVRLLDRENMAVSVKRSRRQKQTDRKLNLFTQLENEVDLGERSTLKRDIQFVEAKLTSSADSIAKSQKIESKGFLL